MIRNEQNLVRVLCDGCNTQTAPHNDLPAMMIALPSVGWIDLGQGMTRQGRPFQHLCPKCFSDWKASDK